MHLAVAHRPFHPLLAWQWTPAASRRRDLRQRSLPVLVRRGCLLTRARLHHRDARLVQAERHHLERHHRA